MLIFLVTINTETNFYLTAEHIISEVGARSYGAQDQFFVDGVQDPYRAVDESDAVVWVEMLSPVNSKAYGDYNPLYGETVLRRALDSGKPVFYYQITTDNDSELFPEILGETIKKRRLASLSDTEKALRIDLLKLVSEVRT